jgi:hypothetical protein
METVYGAENPVIARDMNARYQDFLMTSSVPTIPSIKVKPRQPKRRKKKTTQNEITAAG